MPIKVNTQYTKERLVRFNHTFFLSKKLAMIILGLCTSIVFLCFLLSKAIDPGDNYCGMLFILILIIDGIYFLVNLGVPYLVVKKSPILNMVTEYSFYNDEFSVSTVTKDLSETLTSKYTVLKKVMKKDRDLYLFISPRQAYIVDLTSLSSEDVARLKGILNGFFKPKNFKWK